MSTVEERIAALGAACEVLMAKAGAFTGVPGPAPAEIIEIAEWILTGQHTGPALEPGQWETTQPVVSWTGTILQDASRGVDPDDDAAR